jgi:hypothetical protein
MATPLEIIQKVTTQTKSVPAQIIWHGFMFGNAEQVKNEQYTTTPETDMLNWHSQTKLNNSLLASLTFTAKIYVNGDFIATLTDNSTSDVVSTPTNFTLTVINATAPIQVLSATLDKPNGILQINWSGLGTDHIMLADYEFAQTSGDLGTLSYVYATGDTPYLAQPQYSWGIVAAYTPKNSASNIKTQKFILYSNRQSYYVLEPDSSTAEGQALTTLISTISALTLDPFKTFLSTTGGVILG